MSSGIVIVVVALVTSLFMAFTVGANSNSAPIAPAVGANAISTLKGALLVGLVAGSSESNGVSPRETGYTVGAWIVSMVGGAAVSFALYHALAAVPELG